MQPVLLTHGDSIDKVADNFKPIAQSSSFCAGICNEKLHLYGVQFHPEVDLTDNGKHMLKNFLFDIAGLTGNYTMDGRENECIKYIKDTVGENIKFDVITLYKDEVKSFPHDCVCCNYFSIYNFICVRLLN